MELPPGDIGTRLRQAREQRRLTLRDIANATKISVTALKAIERNDFDRLPGGVFRRAYVRAFAAEVGLDADELAREYLARFESECEPASTALHDVPAERRARIRRWVVVGASAAVMGVLITGSLMSRFGWIDREGRPEEWMLNQAEADVPARVAQINEADVGNEQVFADAVREPADLPSLRLDIQTSGPCWLSAVADGKSVVRRLMQPGERVVVEAHDAIVLRAGDAGAIVYSLNGAAGQPLGRNGEVVAVHITVHGIETLVGDSADPAAAKAGRENEI